MKTKFLGLLLALGCVLPSTAEQALQVVPFQTKPGITFNKSNFFLVNLSKEATDNDVYGLQFDMKLPKGMSIKAMRADNRKGRFPTDFLDELTHKVNFNTVNGITTVLISNDPSEPRGISGTEGSILIVFYETDATLQPGLHPIEFTGIKIALNGETEEERKLILDPATSYCYVGESPIKTEKHVDLSFLANDVPSFVMNAVNTDLAANTQVESVDMTSVNHLGSMPLLNHTNALCYVKANTPAATELDNAKTPNIIKKDADTYTCSQLTLNEAYPFHCDQEVKVDKASLVRNPLTAQWNTLCLPFDLSQEQLVATFGEGTYVQDFTNFENNSLYFNTDATGYSANQPSLLYVAQPKTAQQYDFGAVTLQPTTAQPAISFNGATFKGNYDGNISATGYFGVTPDSKVMIGGSKATLNGFKACFELPSTVNVQKLNINHGDVTGVETVGTVTNESNVYSLNGTLLMENAEKEEVIRHLPKGIYIINNKKVIVK